MAIVRVKISAGTALGGAVGLTTLPTTIHQSTTVAGTSDEVHIWVANRTSAAVTCVLYVGTTGNFINVEVPGDSGPFLVSPGLFLADGGIIAASSNSAATNLFAYGFANRLTTGA